MQKLPPRVRNENLDATLRQKKIMMTQEIQLQTRNADISTSKAESNTPEINPDEICRNKREDKTYTVGEHEFVRLSRSAIGIIGTEKDRSEPFLQEFHLSHHSSLVGSENRTYLEEVDAVLQAEVVKGKYDRCPKFKDNKRKGPVIGQPVTKKKNIGPVQSKTLRINSSEQTQKRNQQRQRQCQGQGQQTPQGRKQRYRKKGDCTYCGKSGHTVKDCRFANKLCFMCGKDGHYSKRCPNKAQVNPTPIQTEEALKLLENRPQPPQQSGKRQQRRSTTFATITKAEGNSARVITGI